MSHHTNYKLLHKKQCVYVGLFVFQQLGFPWRPSPLFWVKKEDMTEEEKPAGQINPTLPPSGLCWEWKGKMKQLFKLLYVNWAQLTLKIRDSSNDAGLSTSWNTGGEEPMICQRPNRRTIPVINRTICRQKRSFIHRGGSSLCCNKTKNVTDMISKITHNNIIIIF